MKTKIYFLLIAFTISSIAIGQVINVPGDYESIQQGINVASVGDTVLVDTGIYFENINFNGKAITVSSHFIWDGDTNYINNTIIDGSQPLDPDSASVVAFVSGEDTNSIVMGFTITGGTGMYDSIWHVQFGGGIGVANAGAKIDNNKIIYNTVDSDSAAGGVGIQAIAVEDAANFWLIVRNNTISHNKATSRGKSAFGGGLSTLINSRIENNIIEYNECENLLGLQADGGGVEIEHSSDSIEVTIIGNTIRFNTLNTDYVNVGAGISLLNASAVIKDNVISYNLAISNQFANAGGIYVYGNPSEVIIEQNEIIGNEVLSENWARGGAIGVWELPNPVKILNNTIEGNKVDANNNRGPGIWMRYPDAKTEIIGNLFKDNRGRKYNINSSNGGAISIMDAEKEIIIDRNLFNGNEMYSGGGIYIRRSVMTTISNNLFDGNNAVVGGAINYYYPSGKFENRSIRPLIVNNTIINNLAESTGGGIRYQSSKITPVIFNSIIRDNEAGQLGDNLYCTTDAEFVVSYSDIPEEGIVGNWRGTNNIDLNPDFHDDSCHLDWSSLCVNAGIDSLDYLGVWYLKPLIDIDGDYRPYMATLPDIGADESPYLYVDIPETNTKSVSTILAFPNPLTNTTTIEYGLAKSSFIEIKIYNQLGKQIEIIQQKQSAGEQRFVWNAAGLPAGIYYCVLKTENRAQTVKMIKIK